MSVLILTRAAGVTQDMVARVRHAADLPAARRLGPGGVDFAATPEALLAAREALEEFPVDVNLLPRLNRRKRLLIADMDSTIITVECIDEIADMLQQLLQFPSNARWLSPGRLSSRKDNCILQIHRINAVATSVNDDNVHTKEN